MSDLKATVHMTRYSKQIVAQTMIIATTICKSRGSAERKGGYEIRCSHRLCQGVALQHDAAQTLENALAG